MSTGDPKREDFYPKEANFRLGSDALRTTEIRFSEWQVFQFELGAWADATFGEGRPPERSFSHLQEEVEELIAAPYDLKEYADCFILLIDSARRAGYDMETILKACNEKLEINKKRKGGTPDASGKVNHVPGT